MLLFILLSTVQEVKFSIFVKWDASDWFMFLFTTLMLYVGKACYFLSSFLSMGLEPIMLTHCFSARTSLITILSHVNMTEFIYFFFSWSFSFLPICWKFKSLKILSWVRLPNNICYICAELKLILFKINCSQKCMHKRQLKMAWSYLLKWKKKYTWSLWFILKSFYCRPIWIIC